MKSTMDNVQCTNRVKRTFEEIIKELAEKLPLWNLQKIGKKVAHFNTVNGNDFVIWRDGSFGVDGFFSPDQLTDIAAACTEIAAIRKGGEQ